MNLRFTCNDKDFLLEDSERKFLFPYLIRFALANQIDLGDAEEVEVGGSLAGSLSGYIEEALGSLLQDGYEPPSSRGRQRHYTHYRKFEFKGRRYVVNYTTSTVGRLIYQLALRLRLIEEGHRVFLLISKLKLG